MTSRWSCFRKLLFRRSIVIVGFGPHRCYWTGSASWYLRLHIQLLVCTADIGMLHLSYLLDKSTLERYTAQLKDTLLDYVFILPYDTLEFTCFLFLLVFFFFSFLQYMFIRMTLLSYDRLKTLCKDMVEDLNIMRRTAVLAMVQKWYVYLYAAY